MSSFRVKLTGLEKAIAIGDRLKGPDSAKAIQAAMYAEATTILNESKKIVPVATGNLRASGKVERPQRTGNRYTVEITYGGAAAPYALFVHEIPPSTGGRWGTGNKHKAGKTYKFLEIPVMAHKDLFVDAVKQRVAVYLLGRR